MRVRPNSTTPPTSVLFLPPSTLAVTNSVRFPKLFLHLSHTHTNTRTQSHTCPPLTSPSPPRQCLCGNVANTYHPTIRIITSGRSQTGSPKDYPRKLTRTQLALVLTHSDAEQKLKCSSLDLIFIQTLPHCSCCYYLVLIY